VKLTFQQKINNISWLVAAYEERLNYLLRVSAPLYAYLDIVFSTQFCTCEIDWKKTKMILVAIKNKLRQLLKNGLINPAMIKSNIMPYSKRLNVVSQSAYENLKSFLETRNNFAPKEMIQITKLQNDLVNCSLNLIDCVVTLDE